MTPLVDPGPMTGAVEPVDPTLPPSERWRQTSFHLMGARVALLALEMVASDVRPSLDRLGLLPSKAWVEDSIEQWRTQLGAIEMFYVPNDRDYGAVHHMVSEVQITYADIAANLKLWAESPLAVEAELGHRPLGWEHHRENNLWFDYLQRACLHQLADQAIPLVREDVLGPRWMGDHFVATDGREVELTQLAPAERPDPEPPRDTEVPPELEEAYARADELIELDSEVDDI